MDELILWSIPVFVISIALEMALSHRGANKVYADGRDTLANLAMGLGNVILSFGGKFLILAVYGFVYQFRLFDIPTDTWWAWALLILPDDFCYYWFHRCHHRVRLFWCTHVNHHSSQQFNLAVALRQPWTEPLTMPWFWLPLLLIGFHPLMVMTQQAINLLYQFFVHTQKVKSLGPLEKIMNTPAHHRVHHGTNPQYLDKNYGGIFIVWDRLFGTYEPEIEPVRYGLVHNLSTYHPLKIAFHEWAAMLRDVFRAPSLRQRARAALLPPGVYVP